MKAEETLAVLDIEQIESAANRLNSIAHPMRVAIIDLLQEHTKMSVTEIYKAINIEQAATSHHLKILKEKGILNARRDGKKIFYSIRTKSLKNIVDVVNKCYGE